MMVRTHPHVRLLTCWNRGRALQSSCGIAALSRIPSSLFFFICRHNDCRIRLSAYLLVLAPIDRLWKSYLSTAYALYSPMNGSAAAASNSGGFALETTFQEINGSTYLERDARGLARLGKAQVLKVYFECLNHRSSRGIAGCWMLGSSGVHQQTHRRGLMINVLI